MARKSREEWSPKYRARIERAEKKFGVLWERDQSKIRQLARGHRAREHITRKERIISRGEVPTSTADYSFLVKQRNRIIGDNPNGIWPYDRGQIVGRNGNNQPVIRVETNEQRYERAKTAYLNLPRNERDTIRLRQITMERRYRGFKKKQSRTARSRRNDFQQRDEDYSDDDFYDWVEEMSDDITPIYFYH